MSIDQREKLLHFVRLANQQDTELREQYNIGDKFRFIRDRLQALLKHVEESLASEEADAEPRDESLAVDEVFVYVHLYNAQGLVLQTWQKMVSVGVLYDHSINRPIYTDKSHVDAFIRSKSNKAQHGYLSIAVKKITIQATEDLKDAFGNPIVKVKEGSLLFDKVIAFTHNGVDYVVKANGELIKK
jgi:hypothetical protein